MYLEVTAEMCLCLTMEVMLENWMGDIFFFQSVSERLRFSRIHTEYVLMIQVLLFKDNTIENFLQCHAVCFFTVFVTSISPTSLASHVFVVLFVSNRLYYPVSTT